MFSKINGFKQIFTIQLIFGLFFTFHANASVVGDIDGDGKITLKEAIYALQVVAGIKPSPHPPITGYLQHNGIPMPQLTYAMPLIWFRNEVTGQVYEDAIASYSNIDGSYEIKNLTGTIGISISFHVNGSFSTFPGNYRKWTTMNIDSMTDFNLNIEIEKIIHLIKPFDNNNVVVYHPPYSEHDSPVIFQWEPVTGATTYKINIKKTRDAEHPEGYGYISTVISQTLQSTEYSLNLETSEQYEHYEFSVTASNSLGVIGFLMTTFNGGGHGWDYRFKIVN